jgi:hypothetical protein
MEIGLKGCDAVVALDISRNKLVSEKPQLNYLIECNVIYQQLDKMGDVVTKNKILRESINSLFLSLSLEGTSLLPSELRYEIAKHFIIELKLRNS